MNYIKEKRNNKLQIVIIIWVALWSINIFGLGTKVAMFLGVLLFLKLVLGKKKFSKIYVNNVSLIVMFGIVYTLLINFHTDISFLRGYREVFLPAILYSIAFFSFQQRKHSEKEKYFVLIIHIIAFSLFIYATLNLFVHLSNYGTFSYYNRLVFDIWSGQLTAATTQGSRLIMMSSLAPPMILYIQNYKKKWVLLILVSVIITFASTLILANRTLLVIFAINMFISLLLFIKINNNNKVIVATKLILIIVSLLFLYILIYNDFLLSKTFIENSNFYLRTEVLNDSSILENSRFTAWRNTIIGLVRYPLGGSQSLINISAPHNLWLDIAYTTGVFPLVLLLLITLSYFKYFLYIITSKLTSNYFKIFLSSISISLLLNLMVEPILGGHYILFMIFIFQLGLMHGMYSSIYTQRI